MGQEKINSQKNITIEVLRGVAILLLIVDHVIGSTPEGGMKINYPSIWRYIYLHDNYIGIPLFTAMAGWVYAIKGAQQGPFFSFFKSKFIRLMIPAFAVGTVYFLVQYFTPGTNIKPELSSIWRIYVFPYTLYWFLPSLFLITLSQWALDRLKLCDQFYKFLILLGVAYLMRIGISAGYLDGTPNLFSYQGAMGIYIYFLIGVGANRYKEVFGQKSLKPLWTFCTLASFALLQIIWFCYLGDRSPVLYRLMAPLLLCGTLMLLMNLHLRSKFLVWIGSYSYGIYLFHGFGTSGGRIILSYMGVSNQVVVFFVSFVISLLSSILITMIFKRWNVTNFLFLGVNVNKNSIFACNKRAKNDA